MTQTEPENSSGSCCLFFPPWSLFVSPHLHPSQYHHPSHHPIPSIVPILAITQSQTYPLSSPPFLLAAHPRWRWKGGSHLKWMEGCRMLPPAAWGKCQKLPQQREGWEAGGSWDSCWEVSCLPAPALQLPLTSATLLGKYGHHFPFGGGGSSDFPHPLSHI